MTIRARPGPADVGQWDRAGSSGPGVVAVNGLVELTPADRHRAVAANLGRVIGATADWTAPTPVPEWTARDVVEHLLEWLPGFLAGGGVDLAEVDTADLPTAWVTRAAAVQELLDDPDAATFTHPNVGSHPLDEAIDRFYTADVYMHTWDLARAVGCDAELDGDLSAALLAGMEPIADALVASGQFGPAVPIAADADPADRLMAFIGRDPAWAPPDAAGRQSSDR